MMADIITPNMEYESDVRYWLGQIESSQKWHKDFHDEGKEVVKRYIARGEDQLAEGSTNGLWGNAPARMNVFWSNVQTQEPALYARTPSPAIQRRFRDRDPVGRWASTVLERCESYELDAYDDDYNYRMAVKDLLIPGRGQVWVYYEPTISGGDDMRNRRIEWECCRTKHLNWKDFITNPARTWEEVWWVAKREYLSKEEAEAQRLDVKNLTFATSSELDGSNDPNKQSATQKAEVWEIWSKLHNKVFFVSPSGPKLLRPATPPGLKLENFFPCPRPLTATTTTDSILPRADFAMYVSQALEINRLTQRINLLTKALRVAGVYDASQEDLGRLLEETENNALIPCATYAVLAAQGGVEGAVSFFPMKEIIAALQQAYASRDQAEQAMYRLTGISDIVRGASDPNETATAQQIKSQWGGLRIRDRQREVQRFIRDVMRIKAEIHAEQFQPETLWAMSNVKLPDQKMKEQLQMRAQAQQMAQQNPEQAQAMLAQNPQLQALAKPFTEEEKKMLKEPTREEVIALLRNDRLRGFSIDVETDSTIQADEQAEKMARTEFVTALTGFIQQWGPMVAQEPKLAPLAGETLLFATRAFPASDSLQTVIEEFVEGMENKPIPQPQPDPKAQAALMDAQTNEKKQQSEAANKQLEIQTRSQTELQTHAMTLQADAMESGHERQADREIAGEERQMQAQQGGDQNRQLAGAINTLAQQQQMLSQQVQQLMAVLRPEGTA